MPMMPYAPLVINQFLLARTAASGVGWAALAQHMEATWDDIGIANLHSYHQAFGFVQASAATPRPQMP